MKVNTVKKAINVFIPKTSAQRFIEKPEIISIFPEDLGKIKYVHNVLEYKPRQTTPDEVKSLFIDGKLGDNYLKDEMKRIKWKLLKSSFSGFSNFKKWKHSVSLSNKLTESDLADIADFMNMHNGKFINLWRGTTAGDNIPNIEKLALFVRSIKRIDKLKFYKNLPEKEWENCIAGIIKKPREVVRALMEYKLDSRKINNAISDGTNSQEIKDQIKAIEKFLNTQSLKNDMTVYRGEGNFGIFGSVILDEKKNITLKDVLEDFTTGIERGIYNQNDTKNFAYNYMLPNIVKQERFMSTAIEPSAIEPYAQKVYWTINVPKKTKASMIESYNVERESEAELLIQKGSQLLIKNAEYDFTNRRWNILADLKQSNIAEG